MPPSQIFSVRVSGIRPIITALNRFKRELIDGTAEDIWDPVIDLFESFLNDPSVGFGTAVYPGRKGEINYRGDWRNSIGYRRSKFKLQVIEASGHGEKGRRGSKPTGKFDKEVYFWALRKPLGAGWVIRSGASSAVASAYRLSARRMALSVAKKGTSEWYRRTRHPLGRPGWDYPDYFQKRYGEQLQSIGIKASTTLRNRLLSRFPAGR